MADGREVTSVPPYYPDLLSHTAAAALADNSVVQAARFVSQQSNGGFNPFPQVETISRLISSLCASLSVMDSQLEPLWKAARQVKGGRAE